MLQGINISSPYFTIYNHRSSSFVLRELCKHYAELCMISLEIGKLLVLLRRQPKCVRIILKATHHPLTPRDSVLDVSNRTL
jgi:hypothetical protein